MIRTAVIDITPPVGLDLAGWAFGPSVGIHDRLWAKSVFLEGDDGTAFLLIAADLIGLGTETADRIRDSIASGLGISRASILISCSHTHSGPGTMPLRRWGPVDTAYLAEVTEKLIAVGLAAGGGGADPGQAMAAPTESASVRESSASLSIGFGSATVPGICVNRRGDAGNVIDETLGIIRAKSGDVDAVVWNYSCHPVAAHNYRNLISADYPGVASELIESELGPGSTALFTLGAAGDINPGVFHHMRYARRYGRRLGRAARRLLPSIAMTDRLSISCASRTVKLPVQDLPDESFLQSEIDTWGEESERLELMGAPKERVDNALIKLEWAKEALAVRSGKNGTAAEHLEMELQAVRLNDWVILALPAELFVQIGLNIKQASPFEHTCIVELANGNLCYLPTSEAYDRGGYETEFSAKVYGLYFLDRRAQPLVEHAAAELLKELA